MTDLTNGINNHMNFEKPDIGVLSPAAIPRTTWNPVAKSQNDTYAPQQGQYTQDPQDPAALRLTPEMMQQMQQQAAQAASKAKRALALISAVIIGTVLIAIPKCRNFVRKAVFIARKKPDPKLTITSLHGEKGLKGYKKKILEITTPDSKKTGNRLLEQRDIKSVNIRIKGGATESEEALKDIQEIANEFTHYKEGLPVINIKLSEKARGKEAEIFQKLKSGSTLDKATLNEIESLEMKINHKKKGFGIDYDITVKQINNTNKVNEFNAFIDKIKDKFKKFYE